MAVYPRCGVWTRRSMPHMVCVARFTTLHLACQRPLTTTPLIANNSLVGSLRTPVDLLPLHLTPSIKALLLNSVVAHEQTERNKSEGKGTGYAPEDFEYRHVTVMWYVITIAHGDRAATNPVKTSSVKQAELTTILLSSQPRTVRGFG